MTQCEDMVERVWQDEVQIAKIKASKVVKLNKWSSNNKILRDQHLEKKVKKLLCY